MNVFVDGRKGDCGYTLLDPRVDLFRAGVARHRLHDLIENLALVGRGEPVILTKFTEGTGLDTRRGLHQELVNDNYSCSSSVPMLLQGDPVGASVLEVLGLYLNRPR